MARTSKEELPDMGDEGEQVKARRERLGLSGVELAKASGVHRNTLSAIENGESGHRGTLQKVVRVLEELEAEAGFDVPAVVEPAPHMRMIHLKNDRGEVILDAGDMTPEDAAELAMRLLRELPRLEE